MDNTFTLVSSTDNALLLRKKDNNLCYRIHFKLSTPDNKPINPTEYIDFYTYDELFELNSDVLNKVTIEEIDNEPNSRNIIMEIKPLSSILGINGKYIITKINKLQSEEELYVCLFGSSIQSYQTNLRPSEYYEELLCRDVKLFVFWDKSENGLIFQYDFTLIEPTLQMLGFQIPQTISNSIALIIKKMFLRMKNLKEKQISKKYRLVS